MVNFMRHLHRRASFLCGHQLRDNTFLHYGNILMEVGLRECCQLVDKELRSDWHDYPHSFLIYSGASIQVNKQYDFALVDPHQVHACDAFSAYPSFPSWSNQ